MISSTAMSLEDRQRIEAALFFEPPKQRERLTRFAVLIALASVIATCGLLADSVASVIGAMIISPLMTPIMGLVVALIIGARGRAMRSLVLVVAGIVISIGIGWLVAKFMPLAWDPLSSSQVMARTSPRVLDLVIALASGAAGAYALSRSDVADSLPGVAIAISLVPPLNNCGILLAADQSHLAFESFLLFFTNFVAILIAGSLTFVLSGLAKGYGRDATHLRNLALSVAVLLIAIAIPLSTNHDLYWNDIEHEDAALAVVQEWLAGTDWEVLSVDADGNELQLMLAGDGPLPDSAPVVEQLQNIMGEDSHITARIVGLRKEVISNSISQEQVP
ncbi:MAG: TIGR00341 family protein [Thermomicrobiales bacterium]|nr:TIGR00341 family protein [Thermomicrobiales bacterium]